MRRGRGKKRLKEEEDYDYEEEDEEAFDDFEPVSRVERKALGLLKEKLE